VLLSWASDTLVLGETTFPIHANAVGTPAGAHLEETGLELDVPETVEQLSAWHEALSAERAAPA
jgi:hypothetical protein